MGDVVTANKTAVFADFLPFLAELNIFDSFETITLFFMKNPFYLFVLIRNH